MGVWRGGGEASPATNRRAGRRSAPSGSDPATRVVLRPSLLSTWLWGKGWAAAPEREDMLGLKVKVIMSSDKLGRTRGNTWWWIAGNKMCAWLCFDASLSAVPAASAGVPSSPASVNLTLPKSARVVGKLSTVPVGGQTFLESDNVNYGMSTYHVESLLTVMA